MKIFILLFLLLSNFILGIAQQTMTITNGSARNGIERTIPYRDIVSTDNGVEVTYQFENIIIQEDPDFSDCKILKIDGFTVNDTELQPAILYRRDYIALPSGYTASVSITNSEFVDYPFKIGSSLPPVIDSSSKPLYSRQTIAQYSGLFPESIVSKENEDFIKGNRIATLCISPLQYDMQNMKTRIYTSLTYRVDFIRDETLPMNVSESDGQEDESIFSGLTVNELPQTAESSAISLKLRKAPGYLILTTNKFLPAAKRFAEWKKLIGFNVEIVSKDKWEVDSVKSTVASQNSEIHNLRYLLIIGDYEDIPAKTSSIGCNINDIPERITDYYYGFTDISPNSTITAMNKVPDLYRGRLSVNSLEEAEIIVDKIINYEASPSIDSTFYKSCSHLAYFQDQNDIDSKKDGYEDRRFARTSEDIREYMLSKGKNIERIYSTPFDVIPTNWNRGIFANGENISLSLKKPLFSWNGNTSDIIRSFNEGKYYILYRGHGTEYSWFNPSFSVGNFSELINSEKQPVVFSIACLTGKFNKNNCFAESLNKKPNSGAVAVIAASEISYSGYNDGLACGLFDAIYPTPGLRPIFPSHNYSYPQESSPCLRLGQILDRGCLIMDQTWGKSPTYRLYTKEVFHLFGDPSMQIRTEVPTPFEGIIVNRNSSTVSVSRSQRDGKITLYDALANKVMVTNSLNIDYRCQDPYQVSVSVTASNRIPFLDISFGNSTIYIQNEKFSFSKKLKGKKVIIGSSVTDKKDTGDVIFEKGKYVISGKNIVIGPGTKIEKGTEIVFKTD